MSAAADPFAPLWWLLALRGAAGVLFGVAALAWPLLTLELLLLVFAVYVFVDGAAALSAGLSRAGGRLDWWPLAVEGALGLALGGAILLLPDRAAFRLLHLIAGWALATGACEIVAAVRLRRYTPGETLLAGAGIASVVLGGLLLGWPKAAVIALTSVIGVYALAFGALLVALSLRLRRLARRAAAGRPGWVM